MAASRLEHTLLPLFGRGQKMNNVELMLGGLPLLWQRGVLGSKLETAF